MRDKAKNRIRLFLVHNREQEHSKSHTCARVSTIISVSVATLPATSVFTHSCSVATRLDTPASMLCSLRRRGESVLGSWGKAMRDALRNKESLERAPCAYPRSWY